MDLLEAIKARHSVRNYFFMAGPKGRDAEETVGYHGEALVLLAQTLGLNTCRVGLTYKKIPGVFSPGWRLRGWRPRPSISSSSSSSSIPEP